MSTFSFVSSRQPTKLSCCYVGFWETLQIRTKSYEAFCEISQILYMRFVQKITELYIFFYFYYSTYRLLFFALFIVLSYSHTLTNCISSSQSSPGNRFFLMSCDTFDVFVFVSPIVSKWRLFITDFNFENK